MADEVAVFIDFENLRYGLLNTHGIEPDVMALVQKARKYGRPTIMRAYADFSEHPTEIVRRLEVAGVECISLSVKRNKYKKGGETIERIKNASDMILALDAILHAMDADAADNIKVFFLVTGDGDYVKLVTNLRNRFGQRVVICGVPGTISNDLVSAAGETDHIEVQRTEPVDKHVLKSAICAMVKKGPSPLTYWTMRIIDQWTQDARQKIPGLARERRDALNELLAEKALTQEEFRDPKTGATKKRAALDERRAKELGYLG
jgi:uncharacterized LabA/DUF88 family protein